MTAAQASRDCESLCLAIRAARSEAEVIMLVREYLSSLGTAEAALIPPGLTSLAVSHAEEVVQAALELAHREALAAYDAPEAAFLKDAVKVFAAASMRLASLTLR
jgi:hypothetical protein